VKERKMKKEGVGIQREDEGIAGNERGNEGEER